MAPEPQPPSPPSLLAVLARRLERSLAVLVALVLLFMMLLTFIDVLGRYLLNAPLPGAFELTELAMGLLIFSALPLATKDQQHVTIGLLDGLFRGPARRLRRIVLDLISAAALAGLAHVLWREAQKLRDWGDYTAYLHIPLAPVIFFMAAMGGLAAAILLALALAHATGRAGAGGAREGDI